MGLRRSLSMGLVEVRAGGGSRQNIGDSMQEGSGPAVAMQLRKRPGHA
jgi:hypothetical protein